MIHRAKDGLPDPLWEYHDVSEYLHVPERTLRRWVASGDGPPPLRLGRSVRFRIPDVIAWLDERARAAPDPRPRPGPVRGPDRDAA